jgi:hypothetical protein
MLEQAYVKTEQGRAEIKARAQPLSRSVRNLLLLIDGSKSAGQWLELVQGATAEDLALLIQQGLIAPAGLSVAAPVRTVAPPALPSLDQQALYAFLTSAARQRLGLIKGYRWVLDVERCGDLTAMQQLALRFVDEVRQAQGDSAAAEVRRDLGLPL